MPELAIEATNECDLVGQLEGEGASKALSGEPADPRHLAAVGRHRRTSRSSSLKDVADPGGRRHEVPHALGPRECRRTTNVLGQSVTEAVAEEGREVGAADPTNAGQLGKLARG